ncbi:MAG TPA: O-antigen ligase family protein [Bryobacteraceae bacterium]|nr:O-antigen ligase family protein [Bryobacteraceae bacterium]
MESLTLVPGLVAAVLATMRSPAAAFLNVYLPVLLLLPDYYYYKIVQGLPQLSFAHAAILPIAVVMLARGIRWRWSVADFLVLGFAVCLGFSEYWNAGYKEAQNLMFDLATSLVLPYAVTKALVEPLGLRAAFARRLAWMLFLVSVISLFEFRLGRNPFRMLLDPFFPGQAPGWVTTIRWGFGRIGGPYGHAILAGIMLLAGWRIARWLERSGQWEAKGVWNRLPLPRGTVISLGLLGGLLMTMSRGPWIGAILATALGAIGRVASRKRALLVLGAGILLLGIPTGIALYRYSAVGRAAAKTPAQETAAYRKELIDKYIAIALKHSAWGWGRNTWPKVGGMPSIDNYYLLLTLMYGLPSVAFFLSLEVAMPIRLIADALRRPSALPRGSSLPITLAGIYLGIAFALATVYMGTQVIPLFAMLTGWSEGYLLTQKSIVAAPRKQRTAVVATPAFRRVLA